MSRELSYSYDLLYDIKTPEQLQNEVEYLTHRLSGIAKLCREDGYPIDDYILTMMGFNLQAAKPEQAQTAVGLPELTPLRAVLVRRGEVGSTHDCPADKYVRLEDAQSYATAKTAEAVRELVEGLRFCEGIFIKYEINRIDGEEITDNARSLVGALIAKYTPKK